MTYISAGDGTITYDVTGLPSGLDVTAGTISGSPSAFNAASKIVSITAQDDNGSSSTTVTFPSVASAAPSGPTWASITAPPSLTVGQSMSLNLSDFITGDGSITYTAASYTHRTQVTTLTVSGSPSAVTAASTIVSITAQDDNETSSTTLTYQGTASADTTV